MGDIAKGAEAGFIATVVISIVLFVQQSLGFMPNFSLINLVMNAAGTPDRPLLGWALHFVVGCCLLGVGFAAFSPHLPGPHWLRGLIFGVLAWIVMMVAFLPAAGLPMFAAGMGSAVLVYTLVLQLLFGVVVGEAYHLLLHYLPSEVDENA